MTIISGVGNTVANMADAMDTTDACTLAIEVKQGPKSLINIISTFEMKMTLSELQKCSMWCRKIFRKCWYRCKCQQNVGPHRTFKSN